MGQSRKLDGAEVERAKVESKRRPEPRCSSSQWHPCAHAKSARTRRCCAAQRSPLRSADKPTLRSVSSCSRRTNVPTADTQDQNSTSTTDIRKIVRTSKKVSLWKSASVHRVGNVSHADLNSQEQNFTTLYDLNSMNNPSNLKKKHLNKQKCKTF